MKLITKIWLIVAATMVLSGFVVYCIFTGNVPMVTNTHIIDGNFQAIIVNVDETDVVILPSTDGICRVVCYEEENLNHNVFVYDHALSVTLPDQGKWIESLVLFHKRPRIAVYLPPEEYAWLSINGKTGDVEIAEGFTFLLVNIERSTGDVKCIGSSSDIMQISTTTGDICVENVTTGDFRLSVSTGNINLRNISCTEALVNATTGELLAQYINCQKLTSNGSTGDVTLENVIAEQSFSIKRSTGDVHLEGCDSGEIEIKTGTGHVTGSLLTGKDFLVHTNTGRVDVPQNVTGGKCEITTGTGNIKITIG